MSDCHLVCLSLMWQVKGGNGVSILDSAFQRVTHKDGIARRGELIKHKRTNRQINSWCAINLANCLANTNRVSPCARGALNKYNLTSTFNTSAKTSQATPPSMPSPPSRGSSSHPPTQPASQPATHHPHIMAKSISSAWLRVESHNYQLAH